MVWCRIKLFGGLRVWINGHPVVRFRTRKTASLLAYLAYHLDRLHPREMLVEMFWSESELAKGRNSLSKAISSLRKQFSPISWDNSSILYADRFYVGLKPELVTTDVSEFDANLRSAQIVHSEIERIRYLEEAVKVYSGSLLPEFEDVWIEPERLRRWEQFESAVNELVNANLRAGNWDKALEYSRLALSVEPLSEIACERLMKVLLALNQPAEALREFHSFRERLIEHFGQNAPVFSHRLKTLVNDAERQLENERKKVSASPFFPKVSDKILVSPNLLVQAGTISLLVVLCRSQVKGDEMKRPLRELIHRNSGRVIDFSREIVVGVFPRAHLALECAFACRDQLKGHCLRCFVDTFDFVENGNFESILHITIKVLLDIIKDDQVVCSESTAVLVKRNENLKVSLKPLRLLNTLTKTPILLFEIELVNPNKLAATNLPSLTTNFFGRSEELEQLLNLFLEEKVKLVTLVGLGGCGKTRLALEFAQRILSEYEGAVWFLPIQGASSPLKMGETLAKVLGLQTSIEQEPLELAIQGLKGKKCLLIWDGFEQVMPEGAKFLRELSERIPDAQFLVTSRCPLNLPWERVLPILPLPFPEPCRDDEPLELQLLSKFPSVQMFVDRAKLVCPDFQFTERNAKKVFQICAQLEGIPLSIELTASWLAKMSLSQILERLKKPLEFLQNRSRNIPERHRSLKEVLKATWQLLPSKLRRVLASMSVFRGGATLDALQTILETEDLMETISELKKWALIRDIATNGSERRFIILDTMAEFVEREIGNEELEQLKAKHANYYLFLAEQFADNRGREAKDWVQWLLRMETERDNLRAALDWTTKNEPQMALRLMISLTNFWCLQGTVEEAFQWAQKIRARISHRDEQLYADASLLFGNWSIRVGNYPFAQTLCESAIIIYKRIGDLRRQGEALLNLSQIATLQGNYETALKYAKKSLEKFKEIKEPSGEAFAQSQLGLISFRLGKFQDSQIHYEQSVHIFESLGDRFNLMGAKVGLANIAWMQGEYEKAYSIYEEALGFWTEVSPTKAAGILTDWGLIALMVGDYERAQKHYEAALKTREKLGDLVGVGAALNGLASVAWRTGKLIEAQKLLLESLSIFQSVKNRWCIALTLTDLGNLALLRGENKIAQRTLSQSLRFWRNLKDPWGIANSLRKLALASARCGKYSEAIEQIRDSMELSESIGDKLGIVESAETLAEILCQDGSKDFAVQLLSAAAKLRAQMRTPPPNVKQEFLMNLLNRLRSELGQIQFEREWQSGQKLNLHNLLNTIKDKLNSIVPQVHFAHKKDVVLVLISPERFDTNSRWKKNKSLVGFR